MSAESTVTVHRRTQAEGAARSAPHLFLALECRRPLALSARYSLEGVDTVVIGRGPERSAEFDGSGGRRVLTIRVPDPSMSHTHMRLERGLGHWVVQDAGSKNGTQVDGLSVRRARLDDGALITLGYTLFLFRLSRPVTGEAMWIDAGAAAPAAPGLLSLVPELEREIARLVQVASSTVTVTIRGETGTGKEILARAVHQLSGRSGPLVPIRCGAAADPEAPVRSAAAGTLLLDEIGDLPPTAQASLLRLLQEQEAQPVEGARLVAATQGDLDALVESGRLRADLVARLDGFRIDLPPLRERREDIGLLAGTLLARLAGSSEVALTEAAVRALHRYDWPHNVRELEKCLAAALVLAAGQTIDVTHLNPAVAAGLADPEAESAVDEEALRARLVELLGRHEGNVSAVARAMGKARMQIHRWMKRFGLEPGSFRRD